MVGVDLIEIEPIQSHTFIKGDIRDPEVHKQVAEQFPSGADVIISDIAPKPTGNRQSDHLESADLVEDICRFSLPMLRKGGTLLVKMLRKSMKLIFS